MTQELTPKDYAIIAARAADEKKATDIIVQNDGTVEEVVPKLIKYYKQNSK